MSPPVCRHLRTKLAFGTLQCALPAWEAGRLATETYWCLCTMEPAGPDDGYSHPEVCKVGRACYETRDVGPGDDSTANT